MTITDGTTSLTIANADEEMIPVYDKSTRRASSGALKAQVAGERVAFDVKVRATPAQFRTLMNILTSQSNFVYYTSEETYPFYSGVDFPLACNVTNVDREWDNRSYYYVKFRVESVDYI